MSLSSISPFAPPPAPVRRDLYDPRARAPVRISGLEMLAYNVTAAAQPAAEKSQPSPAPASAEPAIHSDTPAHWLPPGPVWPVFPL